MPPIDRNSTVPFYRQVYEQISRGIESGLYPAGKKLPSIRECARELGVSNTTIELAYQRLTEEGYVRARRGSGYTICKLDAKPTDSFGRFSEDYRRDQQRLIEAELARSGEGKASFDFAYDAVDTATFPFATWARICREVFFGSESDAACLYNDRQGLRGLREQIAQYLGGEYGLNCVPEQVLVMPTTRDLVSEAIALFDPRATVVAMENPGYDEVGKRLVERGYNLQFVNVHPYPSWDDMLVQIDGADVVFTTPACQFPSNHAMPDGIRRELAQWANDSGAYVIDDEYGWEFQSGAGRMPSLAALDTAGHVITIGTFSNSFTPAVCLSYAVLPPDLMMKWQAQRRWAHPQVPWQTQMAMAMFMSEGHWRTHIRKIRTAMQRKHQLLVNAIDEHMRGRVDVVDGASSLFVLARTHDGRGEDELIAAAEAEGVRVYPTSRYWNGSAPDDWRYVLIGYAGIPAESIEDGVRALAQAWGL